jgi:hypothetical protein
MGERLTVQFARGSRAKESFGHNERVAPRPRRTPFRMMITGLPIDTSWQVRNNFRHISPLFCVDSMLHVFRIRGLSTSIDRVSFFAILQTGVKSFQL